MKCDHMASSKPCLCWVVGGNADILRCLTGAGSYCLPPPQGLELVHTVLVKEHNAIAAKLAAVYPSLSDQQLFDKARMITAAVIAKIHTLEWTPAILPE